MVQSLEDARRRQAGSRPRVPPHNLQAEESLLGAMLLSHDAIAEAVTVCGSADFYRPAHGHVFEAIVSLWSSGDKVDPVTVADELRRRHLLDEIGGPTVLATLQASTPAISNAPGYARIVADHAAMRRLIGAAGELAEIGFDMPLDVDEALDRAESLVYAVAQHRNADTRSSVGELLPGFLDHVEALAARDERVTGVATGFTDLDHQLCGLQPGNLVIVGARPAMGKTAFALNVAAHAALRAGVPALVFSLEMSRLEIVQRIVSAEARVDLMRLRRGDFGPRDWSKVAEITGPLHAAPLFIDDNPAATVLEMRAKARRQKAKEGLGLVVVDYLQLMTGRARAENRQVEIAEISRGLKVLARELDVPVLALSQLSRNLETRADKRPTLADLRESGSLEQDADVVLFPFRSEVYDRHSPDRGIAEVIVAKHRNGPTGTTSLAFIDHFTRFADMARP